MPNAALAILGIALVAVGIATMLVILTLMIASRIDTPDKIKCAN